MKILIALAVVAGCTGPDEVVVTCVTNWQDDDYTDSHAYEAFTASCADWAEHGEVQMSGEESGCVEDGLDAGYATATCLCTADTGRCTFPNGTND